MQNYQPSTAGNGQDPFLRGGGEMGSLMRSHDWANTSLGSPDTWPQSLRTTLGIMLHSAFPMFLFWGDELTCFYNDACQSSLGTSGRHPAIGKPGRAVWPEIWGFIGPIIEQVMTSTEPVWYEDQLLPIYRNGRLEDVYWTFSYSPAYGDGGRVNGVFVACVETTEAVMSRHKLAESETHFRQLTDTVPAILWITEPDGSCNYLNKQWYEQTGQTETQAEGSGWLDATHPDDKEEAGRLFLEANQKQIPFDVLYRLRRKDGSYRWCIDKGHPRFGPNGQYEGMVGTVVDVHDQKMTEQVVRKSETLFQNVTNSSPTGLWLSDTSGALTYLNKTLIEWTGIPHNALLGAGWADAILDEDRQRSANEFLTAVATRAHYDTTFRLKKQDGSLVWCQAAGDPYYHEDGSYAGYAGFCMDIDQLVKQQQAQAISETKFRSLIEEAPIATCLLMGRELRIEVANEAMIEVWGKGPSVIGMTLANALPELRSDPLLLLLDELFVTGQPYHTRASRADQVNGAVSDTYYFDYTFKPLRNADGEVYAIMKMVVDVTEQVMAQQRQEEQIRALAESEERFQAAVVAVQGILWTNNANGEMAGEQPGWSALTGQTYDEYQGFGWSDAVHPDDVQPTTDAWLQAVQARRMFVFEHRVRLRTGDWGLFSVRAIPLLNTDGLVREWVGVHTNITRQRQAEERVRTSEAKLRSVVETAPVAIGLFMGRDLVIELPNQTFIDIVGKGNNIEGKPLREVMPELITENQLFLQILDDVFTSGKPYQTYGAQVKILQQGVMTENYYNITYTPLFDEAGAVYAILDIAVDVTGQVLAQRQIEESHRQLLALFEQSPVGIAIIQKENLTFSVANPFYSILTGRRPDELLGKPLLEALPELEGQGFDQLLREVFATGVPFVAHGVSVQVMRNGELDIVYVDFTYQLLLRPGGSQISDILVVCVDVTQQVLARQKVEQTQTDLLETSQRLSLALDAGNLGSFELERETDIMLCTPQCRANHGQQPEGLATYSGLIDMIVADDRAGVKQAMDHAFDTQTIYHVEYRVLWPDGSLHWIKASGQPIHAADGRPARMVGINQNITAQRMAREELERQVTERTRQLQESVQDLTRSNQNLQQFAYIASHDLQEPLRKIQSFGDLLTTQYADQLGEGVEHLQRMQSAASRMSALIRDLLTFSRISIQQDATAPVLLTAVVQTALNDLDLVVGETGAQVVVEALPTVPGDATQLGQLFQNLLSNALKFRRADVNPVIRVSAQQMAAAGLPPSIRPTRTAPFYHRIDVSDNGIGFDQKYVDRIFQVFQRLHGKNQFAGTGIGLAICEKVAANHGGAITAISQPGTGATFSVYLPV